MYSNTSVSSSHECASSDARDVNMSHDLPKRGKVYYATITIATLTAADYITRNQDS